MYPTLNPIRQKSAYLTLTILLAAIFASLSSQGQQVDNFTTTGTWTCPSGVTTVTVECWGGGGAGGAVGGNPAAGGGGAGGAYVRKVVSVTPGNVYTVTVGATKSSGGKTATAVQNTGNPSWFSSTSTVYAQGGPGAAGGGDVNNFNGSGALGSSANSIGDVVYKGGNGANGASASGVAGGAGGGAAGPTADGGNASGGAAGSSAPGNPFQGSGSPGPSNNSAGGAGSNYGGAGSGGKANTNADRAGGAGGAGYIRITYSVQTLNAPTSLTATAASTSQINLSWTDNSGNETGFEIERSLTSGGGFTLIYTTAANATAYNNTGLDEGTTYYYRVRAVNAEGSSAYTNEASATTSVSAPTAPGGLTATATSGSSITLSWTDNSNNESGFQIERSLSSGSGFVLIYTTDANETGYNNTGLNEGTTYYYRIRAVNAGGQSAYTAEASATTSVAPPAAPSELTATVVSYSAINLNWTDNSNNESGFEIQRSLTSGSGYSLIHTTSANITAYSDSGLDSETTYYYRVRAVNAGGNSSYTLTANATTPVSPQIENFTSSGTWVCPAGVTSVTVECWGGGGAGVAVGGNPAAGGGGAGGAYAKKVITVTPGNEYTITVGGSKSSGNKAATAAQNTGNPSWFGSTSTVYAQGGPGAPGGGDVNNFNGSGALGSSTNSIGDVVYKGGNGANGASSSGTAGGAGGGAAGTSADGGNASAGTGGTGASGNPATGNGASGPNNSSNGNTGSTYGGGGSGGKANTNTDRSGGTGAAGFVRISYEVVPGEPLNAPTNLSATAASTSQINLSWTDNSDNETGFEIERSLTSGSGFTLIHTTAANATSYNNTDLNDGTTYYYRVRAVNTSTSSGYSNESNATTSVSPPSAPTGLTATAVSTSQINLSWTDNSNNESGFEVERSLTPGSGFELVYTTAANATSYSNTGLTAGTTYYYRVRAINAGGNSTYTNEANDTPFSPPQAPSGLTATPVSSTSVKLNWTDNSTNETGFQLERSLTEGSGFSLIHTTQANAVSYTDTDLTPETTYYYRMRAVNAHGQSAFEDAGGPATTLGVVTQALNEWAFLYRYDGRRRMIMKKVPGADWVYLVYDKRDRLVLTQDGNQRTEKKWLFTKYDALNRPIITGIYTHDEEFDQEEMSALISNENFYDSYNGNISFHGYTNNVFPTTNADSSPLEILTVTYYDDYTFNQLLIEDPTVNDELFNYKSDEYPEEQYKYDAQGNSFPRVKGLVTGTKTKVLGEETWLWSVSYFDDRYRVVQNVSTNALGGVDRTTNVYDFIGKVMKSKSVHNVAAPAEQSIARTFDYDHAGRLMKTWHQVNSEAPVLLTANEYNELGELVTKNLHQLADESFAQQIDYRYTIRGWLTTINDPDETSNALFNFKLKYNNPGVNGGSPQYNGNISQAVWKTAGGEEQSYGYSYDPMNRLTEALYYNHHRPIHNGRFNETIKDGANPGYDLNGNILKLQRTGKLTESSHGLMDNLTYDYTGNQLTRVDDAIPTQPEEKGFKESVETDNEYLYDENGNMTRDLNKDIAVIEYNHLNLPAKVTKNNGEYVAYTYDASGRKLHQRVYNASQALQKSTGYSGEFIYENDGLVFIQHEEGRILPDTDPNAPDPWEYQYHLKDHLGNVRVTFSEKTSTTEYLANLEASSNSDFFNYGNRSGFSLFNHTEGGTYSQLLNGGNNGQIGLAKSFDVNAGDVFDLEVYAKYEAPTSTSTNLNNLFNALVGTFSLNPTGGTGLEGQAAYNSFNSLFGSGAFIGSEDWDENAPKAYLNYILFDEDFALVDFGFEQISTDAEQVGASPVIPHDYLRLHVKVKQKGYLYIYLSNEQPVQTNVYFDDFKIVYHTAVEQSDDYYPFGLTFNSYSRENSTENRYLYNQGTGEKTFKTERILDLGLNVDQSRDRVYDYITGRWWQVDPKGDKEGQESWSTYQYGFDNPIRYNDPYGDCIPCLLQLATVDAAVRPNGVGAHALGVAQGLQNSVEGLVNVVSHPVETAKGLGNLALAGLAGNPVNAMQMDAALGTNSYGTMMGVTNAITNGVNNLINGNGIQRGTVIGEIGGAIIGTKGLNATFGALRSTLSTANFGQKLFLSGNFGITSTRFGTSGLGGGSGTFNSAGSMLKMGWSNTAANGGGMTFRIGIGTGSGKSLFHFDVPKTFVPNSFSVPSMQLKQSIFNAGKKTYGIGVN